MRHIAAEETIIEAESELDTLADSLAQTMALAWQRGERPVVEDIFAQHPRLAENPEIAVRLIYEEITLRREHIFGPTDAEILARFPRWKSELSMLLACDRLVQPCDIPSTSSGTRVPRGWPDVGSRLGGFRLLATLGTGTMGRTFLALDPDLADRPVVLKITARGLGEHIALARLQHTNVVPLYAAPEFPEQDLRALCMPYLGGTSLDRVFTQIKLHGSGAPTGRSIIEAIDRVESQIPGNVEVRKCGAPRRVLEQLTYPDAIAWIASQLADALADAHERGLVHMDVKSANVLIAADGTPMLLDFHLAREPVRPNAISPTWVGGTPHSMPPEQRAAMIAVREHRPVTVAVDGRADIYALGRLMQEAFAVPRGQEGVTPGLNAIISQCVKDDPRERYADATSLAQDLRRHLNDEPLVGVRNRSLSERWRKWRRRSPHALTRTIGGLLVTGGLIAVVLYAAQRLEAANQARLLAISSLNERRYDEAIGHANEGLAKAWHWPMAEMTRRSLLDVRKRSFQAHDARNLHSVVDQLRYVVGSETLTASDPRFTSLLKFREVWNKHKHLAEPGNLEFDPALQAQALEDLRDLAILGPNLNIALAVGNAKKEAIQAAADLRQEAERLPGIAPANTAARYYAAGLEKVQANDAQGALAEFEKAIEIQPSHFWSNFRHGIISYRLGNYQDAFADFQVCIALSPRSADCFYNRALVFSALKENERALSDYKIALEIRQDFFDAALNAGQLLYQLKRYEPAKARLNEALTIRPESELAQFNLALVYVAEGNRSAALVCLDKARSLPQATEYRNRLLKERDR